MNEQILISEYTYDLPEDRIAFHPLPDRDHSKLLTFKDGVIRHQQFFSIPELLPPDSILFFNNTRVIPARLLFEKETGARIEAFLLNPELPSSSVAIAMMSSETTVWKCAIGNLKRWPDNTELKQVNKEIELKAKLMNREDSLVEFTWSPGHLTFSEIVQTFGVTPLPPYIKRNSQEADRERYQTVYAKHDGAVAAPTAGLHFTPSILEKIKNKGIATDFLTLHVGAGTFQPVKTENALEHTMHEEQIVITRQNLENLLKRKNVVPVGTTSMRVLESLFWYGVKLSVNPNAPFYIGQNDPYELDGSLDRDQSLKLILGKMAAHQTESLSGSTSIFIRPGYDFKICDTLITNFHQPGSTLILLVAAFVGPAWKKIYHEALSNNYRFLSYGDSSLLFKQKA